MALRRLVRAGVDTGSRMRRAPAALAALLAGASLVAFGCTSAPPTDSARKNVLLITLDGLRQDHISAFGYPRPTTPNLDWLATHGVAFRTVIPTGCATQVSLTSLFTSRSYADGQVEAGIVLRESNVTLAETFADAGYDTAGFVASPVLARDNRFGQGFAVYEDFHDAAETYIGAEQPVGAALRYLQGRPTTRPFFVYLHLEEPHPPWRHPSPWLDGTERSESFFGKGCTYMPSADELAGLDARTKSNLIAKYDGALHYADAQIGRLLEQLRSSGALSTTIIAVSTDHGLELVDRYSATHGHNPFDEVVRTFLILFDHSAALAAAATDVQARIFDIGPTLLAAAQIPSPPSVEGVDLLARDAVVPDLAFTRCYNADVVRTLDYKLIDVDFSVARARGDHLPAGLPEGRQLFDLRRDPGERHDVLTEHPTVVDAMQRARAMHGPLRRDPQCDDESAPRPILDPAIRERLRVLGYEE
jgi:arylsulfatase A-like enzyme